jgi:predicted nucleic acid-binding protein
VASIDDLRGQTVAIDTAPFIYFIEQHPTFLSKVEAIFESAERGEIRAITSVLTLLEVLIHPIRNGRTDLADEYRRILLGSAAIRVFPVDAAVAEPPRW